ncbi:calcium-binding protein [Sphingomonas sp. HITSZ_GF]|nr:calcium-binding protein [Sphingomonas sp. HITSZ_GF]
MLKPMLLATSMLFAIPAFAQETPAQDNTQPAQTAPVPEQATPPVTSDDKAPGAQDQTATAEATPAPVEPTTQPAQGVAQDTTTAQPEQPAAVASTTEPAATPAAQPAATQEQVAQAVGRDFGNYDKDADGKLDATEFTAWMGNLRKAAEPSFQPGSAEATTWANQAFASADTDKSASVNKQELTVFLTPKQPS